MSEDKQRQCGPCCHNGHGEKKSPIKAPGELIYYCWLASCGKKVAWFDSRWRFDPCEHIKRRSNGDIQF